MLRGRVGAGTTVRVFDQAAGLWRDGWYGPALGEFPTLVGRPDQDGITQEGRANDGRPIRWSFSDITAVSFRWHGYIAEICPFAIARETTLRGVRRIGSVNPPCPSPTRPWRPQAHHKRRGRLGRFLRCLQDQDGASSTAKPPST